MTAEKDALELLAEWYDWWIETPGAPEKMPNALHVRTALLLTHNGCHCLFENGVIVRVDDLCPLHSKRPGVRLIPPGQETPHA